jgi:hypothetical protein
MGARRKGAEQRLVEFQVEMRVSVLLGRRPLYESIRRRRKKGEGLRPQATGNMGIDPLEA